MYGVIAQATKRAWGRATIYGSMSIFKMLCYQGPQVPHASYAGGRADRSYDVCK